MVCRALTPSLLGLMLCCTIAGAETAPEKAPTTRAVTAGEFLVDPPSLINLGFEWVISGDDNHLRQLFPRLCPVATSSLRGPQPNPSSHRPADLTASQIQCGPEIWHSQDFSVDSDTRFALTKPPKSSA